MRASLAASEMTRREETERAFLALCIASPEEGARALAGLDVDEHFSSELLRRAARHLRAGDLREPMTEAGGRGGAPRGRPAAEGPARRARRGSRARAAGHGMLEVQRLQLELARVDRQIQRARGQEAAT